MGLAADNRAEAVRLYAAELGAGQQGRTLCPWCAGGSDNEHSLSVLVNERGQVSWRCFRASCSISGGNREVKTVSRKPPRPFPHATRNCEPCDKEWMVRRFDITTPDEWRYSATVDRYVMPVVGPEGQRRGVIARSYSGATPKADTYREITDEPWLHWSRSAYSKKSPIVLVEDVVSAEKVSQCDALGVALLGAYLADAMVWELTKYQRGRPVVLALDKDAFGAALNLQRRHGGHFNPPMTVWRLERDLKDEDSTTIADLIKSVTQ